MATQSKPTQSEPTPAKPGLPTPDQRPDSDVVIYDGHCKMCTAQVRGLLFWDCQHHLSYLSLHDPLVAQRYPDLTHERLMSEMVIVDQQGRRHGGAEAVRHLTLRLRRLWWAAPFLWFPGSLPLWRWLYRLIARNRYRFGKLDECDGGTCQLHFGPPGRDK
jgi:predicted DCC family thiol-disulfide oxidoreductase YuxK